MRRAVFLRLVAFGALGFAVGCGPGEAGPGGASDASARTPAPEFTLPDLSGRDVSLADFRGRTVVIDFWATWCPPCIFQVPELNKLWAAHRERGDVVVLGVAVDVDGAEVVAPWASEHGIEYPVLIGDEALAHRFGAVGFPTLAIVAPDGSLDSLHVGVIDYETLEDLVAEPAAAPDVPERAAL